jgi:hypothetical protein
MGRQLNGRKMFVLTPDGAADAIMRGLANDRRMIAFPFLLAWITRVSALMPAWLVRAAVPSFRVTARDND